MRRVLFVCAAWPARGAARVWLLPGAGERGCPGVVAARSDRSRVRTCACPCRIEWLRYPPRATRVLSAGLCGARRPLLAGGYRVRGRAIQGGRQSRQLEHRPRSACLSGHRMPDRARWSAPEKTPSNRCEKRSAAAGIGCGPRRHLAGADRGRRRDPDARAERRRAVSPAYSARSMSESIVAVSLSMPRTNSSRSSRCSGVSAASIVIVPVPVSMV